jgi:O-acetyl-ADP-ribose deacetylase (regulator of RNase III)
VFVCFLKDVKQRVTECLKLAGKQGLKTVAFVPLGVGRMFNYPLGDVAKGMVSGASQFLKSSSAVEVS